MQRILGGLRVDEGEQIRDSQGGIVHEPLGDLLRAAWGDMPGLRPDAAALSEGLRNEINKVLEIERQKGQCLDASGRGSHPNGTTSSLSQAPQRRHRQTSFEMRGLDAEQ